MDVWRIKYNMVRPHQVPDGEVDNRTFLIYHRVEAQA